MSQRRNSDVGGYLYVSIGMREIEKQPPLYNNKKTEKDVPD